VNSARWITTLALGVIMIALGLYVAVRPLMPTNAPLTGTRWLDMAFALVFMVRGVLNVKGALARRQRTMAQG
jgi:uncharacterized membrane protein HdeD (DUF308 family)